MVPQLDDPHEALKSVEELEEYLTGYFTDGVLRLDAADVDEIEKMAQAFEQFDNQ